MYTNETTKAATILRQIFLMGEDPTSYSIADLIDALAYADDRYFNDVAAITDSQYDSLKQLVQTMEPINPYFVGIGAAVRGGKVPLPYRMGSLDQIYNLDYAKWITKHDIKGKIVSLDKLDGTSAQVLYNNGQLQIAFSRGNGLEGADITRHIAKMPSVVKQLPDGISCAIRAEVITSKDNWPKLQRAAAARSGQPYKNARNAVSGIMNASSNDVDVYQYIDLVAYEVINDTARTKKQQLDWLSSQGFIVAEHRLFDAVALTDDVLVHELNERRSNTPYEIDGLVLEVNDVEERNRITPSTDTLNPAYAVKFKVADAGNYAEPIVTGVTWSISKDGYLKPTINIEPTELVGVTIQKCTGFNAAYIKDNGIGPGARIALTRSGDVIPFCQKVITPSPTGPDMPDMDVRWTETGVDLVLSDSASNSEVQYRQLVDFFNTLDVPHLGEGSLRVMFDAGFTTPDSIIELCQHDLASLVGSHAIGHKIHSSLRARLTDIPEYVLMGAHQGFGRGLGIRKMKKLWEACKGDVSLLESYDFVASVDGFEAKTAAKVVTGMPGYMHFKKMIAPYITFAEYSTGTGGVLSGSTVVFTGFRDKTLERMVVEAGGKMGSAVSKNTTYVITDNPDGSSSKLQKAQALGIPVIGIDKLCEMLK